MNATVNVRVLGVNRLNAAIQVISKIKYVFKPAIVVFGVDMVSHVLAKLLFRLFCKVEVT